MAVDYNFKYNYWKMVTKTQQIIHVCLGNRWCWELADIVVVVIDGKMDVKTKDLLA